MQLHGSMAVAGKVTLAETTVLYIGQSEEIGEDEWDHEPATLSILDGGRFEIADLATVSGPWDGEAVSEIVNDGTFVKTGDEESTVYSVHIINNGTLEVLAGSLWLWGDTTSNSTGAVTVAAEATLGLGGTATFAADSVFDIDGTLHIQGGTTTIDGNREIAAVILDHGTLIIGGDTTIGTLTINENSHITGNTSIGVLILNGKTLTVDGDLVVTQRFEPGDGEIDLASESFLDLSLGDGPAVVHGSGDSDTIIGTPFEDFIDGNNGDNTLIGGLGNDTLIGGPGADRFVYQTPDEGVDTIVNFTPGVDVIVIHAEAFGGGLEAGEGLAANQLVAAAGATMADQAHGQFLYDTDTGALYWDADGTGEDYVPIHIANLTGAPEISASDFELVDDAPSMAANTMAAEEDGFVMTGFLLGEYVDSEDVDGDDDQVSVAHAIVDETAQDSVTSNDDGSVDTDPGEDFEEPAEDIDTSVDFMLDDDQLVFHAASFDSGLKDDETLDEMKFVAADEPVDDDDTGEDYDLIDLAILTEAPVLTVSEFDLV